MTSPTRPIPLDLEEAFSSMNTGDLLDAHHPLRRYFIPLAGCATVNVEIAGQGGDRAGLRLCALARRVSRASSDSLF